MKLSVQRALSFLVLVPATACTFAAFAQTPAQPTLKQQAPAEPPAMEPAPGAADVKGAVKMPQVMIVEPKDGATVAKTFTVKFAVEGMKIAKSGDMTAGTGHHHLIIDKGAVKKGEVIPTDATHLHFGAGQTETKVTLPKGDHTLTLQFADGAHMSYGEMMSQTIKVKVK
jgi:Domain of unknown function (DUF4399)